MGEKPEVTAVGEGETAATALLGLRGRRDERVERAVDGEFAGEAGGDEAGAAERDQMTDATAAAGSEEVTRHEAAEAVTDHVDVRRAGRFAARVDAFRQACREARDVELGEVGEGREAGEPLASEVIAERGEVARVAEYPMGEDDRNAGRGVGVLRPGRGAEGRGEHPPGDRREGFDLTAGGTDHHPPGPGGCRHAHHAHSMPGVAGWLGGSRDLRRRGFEARPRPRYARPPVPRPTKPRAIALGIGAASAACALLSWWTTGVVRALWAWTAVSCIIASCAYVWNRPAWLAKRDGRTDWLRALPILPYLLAFRIACAIMRSFRERDVPTQVAPGLWVSGRVPLHLLPPDVRIVLDLTAEFSAPRRVRRLAGYRSLPVLDGGFPPDPRAFVASVLEAAQSVDPVLVHCDSGRGRAPTAAAAILILRGLAYDVAHAVAVLKNARPVSAPTHSDMTFLEAILPMLRALAPPHGARHGGVTLDPSSDVMNIPD